MENGKPTNASLDLAKWGVASLLALVAVAGNAYFAEQPFLYRLVGVILLIGASCYVVSTTHKGGELVSLLKDARAEARRVVWPTKQETWTTAAIVVVVVLVSALVLWGVDYLLGSLVSSVIG